MNILVLGVGGPGSIVNLRAGSSEVISIGEDNILIDCGWLVSTRLLQSQIKPWDINYLLFTHLFHPDHTVDYPTFALGRMKNRTKPRQLKVYGPEGTLNYSKALFNETMIPDINLYDSWNVWHTISVQDIGTGLVLETEHWKLYSCFTNHQGAHGEPSLAYKIESSEGSVAITGDVGPARRPHNTDLGYAPNRELIELARNVDVFIMDSSGAHTTPEDLGRAAGMANPKKIILSHCDRKPFNLEPEELVNRIRKFHSGKIVVGEELETYSVD